MAACSEVFFCVDDFDAVLAIFRSYDHDVNTSKAVEKIATDEKDYLKCSLCFIACIATASVTVEKVVY